MAVAATHLTTGWSNAFDDVFVTASIAPAANALILAWVLNDPWSSTPQSARLTGCNLQWIEVATVTFSTIASPTMRLTLFRALGPHPVAGPVTIHTFTPGSGVGYVSKARWSISQFTGVATGGHGADAIGQIKTNRSDTGPTSWTTTLDDPVVNHATAVGHGMVTATTLTPEAGWSTLGEVTSASPNRTIQSQWSASGDVSAGVTAAATAAWAAIMVEVRIAHVAIVPALTITALMSGYDELFQVTHTTAPIAPTPGAAVLLWVAHSRFNPPHATISGLGLTWSEITSGTFGNSTEPGGRLSLFVGEGAAIMGSITISVSPAPLRTAWTVCEAVGYDHIVQYATARSTVEGSTWTVALPFALATTSVGVSTNVIGSVEGLVQIPGPGWTELIETGSLQTQWNWEGDQSAEVSFVPRPPDHADFWWGDEHTTYWAGLFVEISSEPTPYCVDDLTDDDLVDFRWDSGDSQLVNKVIFEFDYDDDTGGYTKMVIYSHDESVRKYGPRPEIHIASQGLHSDLGAGAFLEDRAMEIFRRFGDAPPAVLQCTMFYRKHAWEAGDIICVTSDFIPNLIRGNRGIIHEHFELVDFRPQFADQGRVITTFVDIEAVSPQSITISSITPTEPAVEPYTRLGLAGVAVSGDP